jgi:Ca2+-transporting ATPase
MFHLTTIFDFDFKVTGYGYNMNGDVICSDKLVKYDSNPSIARLIEVGAVCNNSQIVENQVRGQPTEGALLIVAGKMNYDHLREHYVRQQEWPFSSETKWMAVKCVPRNSPNEEQVFMKGAISEVIKQTTFYNYNGSNVQLNAEKRKQFLATADHLGSQGLRVIAMAKGTSFNDLTFLGVVGIIDPPRVGVNEAIEILNTSGVEIKMITGDAEETARSIATRLGMNMLTKGCLSGEEIEKMSLVDLKNVVPKIGVFYRTSPKHKLNIVKALKSCGYIVAMTGDGVNDAVALKSADIGVAMGKSGTDVSKEAADMILVDDNFSTIMSVFFVLFNKFKAFLIKSLSF